MADPKDPKNPKDSTDPFETSEEFATQRELYAKLEEEDKAKRAAGKDLDIDILNTVRSQTANPVQPVRITEDHSFCFSCHKGVSCWNECCHGADITLTPFDIIRLSKHLNTQAANFLQLFTVPAMWHGADMPVAKLKSEGKDGKGPCIFMDDEEGCTVYDARPVNCRYYPLGLASVKMHGEDPKDNFYFLVREDHCKGHDEDKQLSVSEFRKEQGVEDYDKKNIGWMEILMKVASWKVMGGPHGKVIDEMTKKMFFMATTDMDSFRKFVFETKFLKTYHIDPELVDKLREDDELLQQLAFDWLKKIIFNDDTIAMRQEVLNDAIANAKQMTARE